MISPTERMIATKDGAIGWMIFNNPARRNAISQDMWEAVPVILDAFDNDPEIRVIVLRGAGGKAFISGADISEFEKRRDSSKAIANFDSIAEKASTRLDTIRKPTIAMIEGYCLGAGVGTALNCDLRIAADNARFAVPAARLGLGYRWQGLKKLVDTVGPANAKEIFLTARQFTADEAKDLGLINRVKPEAELEAYVRSYCALIADNAPLTIEAVKGAVHEFGKPGAQIDSNRLDAMIARCFDSEDYKEGRTAFMEKRRPAFKGR